MLVRRTTPSITASKNSSAISTVTYTSRTTSSSRARSQWNANQAKRKESTMSATISPSDAVFGRMSPAVPARSAQDAAVSFADLPEKAPPRSVVRDLPEPAERELRLQRVLIAYVVAGLFFMLLPGTVLGVWNLISISSRHALDALSPAWLQAHGHAQIFGWIGTFILGIGFYSLSKMGQ